MAELDLNYDPAWLQQRPDSNQPMSLAQAFQLRQHQQQIDAQKALLPLRQQEMQANLANAALDMKIKQEQTDLALKIKANDAAGWARASQVNDWSDPSQVSPIYAEGGKGGGYSPSFAMFLENMQQNAQATKVRALEAAARIRAESKPTATIQDVREATRLEQEALRAEAADDPILARRLRKDAVLLRESVRGPTQPTETSGVKNANERMVRLKARLAATGMPPLTPAEEAIQHEQFVAELTARPAGEETTIEYGPGGTVNIKTRRGGKEGPTVGAETKFQTDIAQLLASSQQLKTMTSTLRPQDVGVAGKINDLKNRVVRQFIPGFGDPTVTSNRAQAERALDDYLGAQVSRGRITAAERDRMRKSFFDPQGLAQEYDTTIAIASRMAVFQQMDAIVLAKRGEQPLSDQMFFGLTKKDFDNLRKSKVLTDDEAWNWFRKVNTAQ